MVNMNVKLLTISTSVHHLVRSLANITEGLWKRLMQLQDLQDLYNITISSKWIPDAENTRADALSRGLDVVDWSVTKAVFVQFDTIFGLHSLNVLAHRYNKNTTCYCVWVDTNFLGNAFLASWKGFNYWMAPPWNLLNKVLHHIYSSGEIKATILALYWPAREWWKKLYIWSVWVLILVPNPLILMEGRIGGLPAAASSNPFSIFRILNPTQENNFYQLLQLEGSITLLSYYTSLVRNDESTECTLRKVLKNSS